MGIVFSITLYEKKISILLNSLKEETIFTVCHLSSSSSSGKDKRDNTIMMEQAVSYWHHTKWLRQSSHPCQSKDMCYCYF
ncbi:hypothetical protein FKM82_010365 [Ascaphus truei]